MEIGTMSSEEFAKSFTPQGGQQNQNQQQNQSQNQQTQQAQQVEFGSKSSEELAAEMANKTATSTNEGKTAEQIATEAEAEKVRLELEEKGKAGRPKTKLDDSFKQGLDKLFKQDKLQPYSDGTKDGYVVPETWEDVVELIDENKKIWQEGSKAKDKDELLQELMSSKSPAWQFILENAATYKDPAELVPLLTAVQNIEYSNSLDPAIEADQVKIIRATLSIQGLPTTSIEAEIEDLKERGKMESRAKDLKPVLDKFNESQADKILQEKQVQDQKRDAFWNGYYENLENTIFKAKEFDGVKLKNEHKQLIAAALIPDEKLGGLPIFTIIENLIAKGDLKTLSKIALLGTDEKLFDSYFLTKKVDKAAEGVQRVLRQSGTSATSTDFEEDNSKAKPIKKPYGFFN